MKGSLIVVAFFVLGVLAGRSGGMPEWMMSSAQASWRCAHCCSA